MEKYKCIDCAIGIGVFVILCLLCIITFTSLYFDMKNDKEPARARNTIEVEIDYKGEERHE